MNTMAVFAGVVVIGLLIFRLIFKTALKIIGGTLVFGIIIIAFLVGTGKMDMSNFKVSASDFKLMDMNELYCGENGIDKVICDCIVKPLDEKLHARYTASEIEDLKKNKMLWLKEIYSILKEHKGDFKRRLQEQGAEGKWDDFVNQFIGIGIDMQAEKAFGELKE